MNESNNRNHYTKLPIGLPLDLHIKWAGNDHHYNYEVAQPQRPVALEKIEADPPIK